MSCLRVVPLRAPIGSDVVASWTLLSGTNPRAPGVLTRKFHMHVSFSYRLQWLALPVVVVLLVLLHSYYLPGILFSRVAWLQYTSSSS